MQQSEMQQHVAVVAQNICTIKQAAHTLESWLVSNQYFW